MKKRSFLAAGAALSILFASSQAHAQDTVELKVAKTVVTMVALVVGGVIIDNLAYANAESADKLYNNSHVAALENKTWLARCYKVQGAISGALSLSLSVATLAVTILAGRNIARIWS
jgi:hypothetical protein